MSTLNPINKNSARNGGLNNTIDSHRKTSNSAANGSHFHTLEDKQPSAKQLPQGNPYL